MHLPAYLRLRPLHGMFISVLAACPRRPGDAKARHEGCSSPNPDVEDVEDAGPESPLSMTLHMPRVGFRGRQALHGAQLSQVRVLPESGQNCMSTM